MKYNNFTEVFMERVRNKPDSVAMRYKEGGVWKDVTYREYYEKSSRIAAGLIALGMENGDRINIFSNTRMEWALIDMGVMLAGGITVAIYHSNTAEEAEYIVNNSEATFIFCENNEILQKVLSVKENIPRIKKAILIEGDKPDDEFVLTLEELMKMGGENLNEEMFKERGLAKKPEDIITFIYTSGTTGVPKGVVLTHANVFAEIEAIEDVVDVREGEVSVMFLPLAHVFARVVYWYGIYRGYINAYAESIEKLLENIQEMKPHFMGSVPRIYEKVYAKITSDVEREGGLKKKIFYWALSVGREVSRRKEFKEPIPFSLKIKFSIARALVFNKLKAAFGGRLRFFLSSGAALAKQIAQFFHSADLFILEVWGMTELTGAATANTFDDFRFGSVGKPLKNIEVKIAEDGELLVRGPIVMKEYYKMPEETEETIDKDGWLHSGDIATMDRDGFIYITDRKKDLIITSGGKNIAPQKIENLMKGDRYINQIIVVGDGRKYLTALVTLNYEEVEKYAREKGIEYKDRDDLAKKKEIYDLIMSRVNEYNKKLASYETIKKIAIIPGEFTRESGELTPTLKVRRKIVHEKYREIIDSMYED